jgi:hypothetical protein
MQTWMHHVSRYDGWSENGHFMETPDAILCSAEMDSKGRGELV